MILEKNGTAFELKLSELDVRLNMKLQDQDASGKSSSSADLNSGTKPKRLMVNGVLPESEAEHLTELIRMAESVETDGQRSIYTISDDVADAADVREVKFTENFDVRPRSGLRAWQINFTLKEHKSVPETKERRSSENTPVTADSVNGQAVASAGTDEQNTANAEHGFVYGLLKDIDNFLAPDKT